MEQRGHCCKVASATVVPEQPVARRQANEQHAVESLALMCGKASSQAVKEVQRRKGGARSGTEQKPFEKPRNPP
eukprot:9037574-Lingulodinium_polyedra.AAC.1